MTIKELRATISKVTGILWCGLWGHTMVWRLNPKMNLHCIKCPYETPGWDLAVKVKQ